MSVNRHGEDRTFSEFTFAGLVDATIERCRSGVGGFGLVEPLLEPSMLRYGLLLERLAFLARARAPGGISSDARPEALAAALRLILTANSLHAKPGLGRTSSVGSVADTLSISEKILLGDYLLSFAFKLLVQIGDMRILRRFSNAAVTMAESDVLDLAATECRTDEGNNGPLATLDRSLGVLSGAALEAAVCLGARLDLTSTEAETLGRRVGVVHLLLHGCPTSSGETVGLPDGRDELEAARLSCLGAAKVLLVEECPKAENQSPELTLLRELLQELGVSGCGVPCATLNG